MDLRQFNTYKILNHSKIIRALLENKNPFPVSCEIDPSNLCNHACHWCYFGDSRKVKKANLDKGVLFKLIDELAAGKTRSITFTGGGEPLVNPATIEAIVRARKKGIRVGLVTNGGLLDRKKNEVIVSCCDFVRISLDAPDAYSHARLHRPANPKIDNFEDILLNLHRLVILRRKSKKDITIGVGFLINKGNYKKLPILAERLKKIGVDYLQIRPIVMPQDNSLTQIWTRAFKYIQKALSSSDKKFHVFPIDYRYHEMINKGRNYQSCNTHKLLAVVGADGNVYMCSLFRGDNKFSFGNLYRQSFAQIWRGKRRRAVMQSLNIRRCPPCRYNRYNEILEYMLSRNKPHADFL
ncbi:MAG: radical SAM protein [Candidatus Omnitrophica bacterium]|nr:radical SAM protein [Candidatus Omnitrophota bacterium]MDD5591970.1 radical SAM protein [Candidatus Omnitrophota bacterium]